MPSAHPAGAAPADPLDTGIVGEDMIGRIEAVQIFLRRGLAQIGVVAERGLDARERIAELAVFGVLDDARPVDRKFDVMFGTAVEAGVTVKFGLDVPAAQITVCRQLDGQLPQPAQRKNWAECEEQIAAHVKAGAVVYTCYEAGPCGHGLHRRVKTDRRDARELCNRLDRYAHGNTSAFATVYVPSVEQERARALCRQRGAVLEERQRCVVRVSCPDARAGRVGGRRPVAT